MSTFELINYACTSINLKNADFRILLCLISFNGRGKIFASLETISEMTGIKGLSRISTSVNKLEEYGYLKIRRRKHLNNLYALCEDYKTKDKSRKLDMQKQKTPKTPKPPKEKPFIDYVNGEIAEATATVVAKLHGYDKPESGHRQFVNTIVKGKENDIYKDDEFNKVRRFLILLYLLNVHSDKIIPNNKLPYGWFKTVYNSQIYGTVRNEIFNQPNYTNQLPYINPYNL